MAKKLNFRPSRRLVVIVGLVLLFAGSTASAYVIGVSNGRRSGAAKTVAMTEAEGAPDPNSEEVKAEIDTQRKRVFAEYKKQIEENKLQGNERTTLYVNAAIAGAAVDAPEAKDYARQALDEMSNEMKRSPGSKDLISRLEKIAAGNYEQ